MSTIELFGDAYSEGHRDGWLEGFTASAQSLTPDKLRAAGVDCGRPFQAWWDAEVRSFVVTQGERKVIL